jgi:Tfp pilus assembly protein PilX
MMAAARTRAREESGVAMAIALIVMMIIAALLVAVIDSAVQTNYSSQRDANKKRALEAAEAGLQIATYRLNMLQPDNAHCVGDQVGSPGASGTCASSMTTLGNGTSYNYYMTSTIGGGTGTCVGLPVTSNLAIAQRCITAVGMANGVTARSQIRVASFAATPVYPYPGMTGLKAVTDLNNAIVNGAVASNGAITDNNGATVSAVVLGPAGTFANASQTPAPAVTVLPSPITASPVDPGTSAQNTQPGGSCVPATGVTQTNCDYRIANYISNPSACSASYPCDPSSKVTFNAATRSLTMNNNATLTLGGGIYNFCEFDAPNNATISFAPGVHAAIYIDSPADPNSGCPAASGNLLLSNNVTWTNLSQDPLNIQLYVYGDPSHPGANTITFTNNTAFWGVLFAPSSTINLSNSSTNSAFWGGITGYVINTSNNYHFNWVGDVATLQANSQGVYYRTAWAQCVPSYSTSTPGAGCG